MLSATSLPNTCAHSIVIASACVGLTLPGMMELPGSFSGSEISPIPERGPEASRRMSLAILVSAAASVFNAPCANTSASWPASAANLFGAGSNGRPAMRATSAVTRAPNSACVFRPVPTAVPPIARRYKPGMTASSAWRDCSSCAT